MAVSILPGSAFIHAGQVGAGPIDWVEEDEAWVTVRYYRTALLSAQRVYRVVEERSGWVCLGQIIQMAPAV